jgi:flagellar basal body-associated protein FliL
MNKIIPTTLGILIIVLVAGVAGASVLFFNQEKEDFLAIRKRFEKYF